MVTGRIYLEDQFVVSNYLDEAGGLLRAGGGQAPRPHGHRGAARRDPGRGAPRGYRSQVAVSPLSSVSAARSSP